jgi:hypothetical protein
MDFMKILRIIVLVIGLIILILSVLADALGLGMSCGFGTRQILGTVMGIIVTAVGIFLLRKNKKEAVK